MKLALRMTGSILFAVAAAVSVIGLLLLFGQWVDPDARPEVYRIIGIVLAWCGVAAPLGWWLQRAGREQEPDWEGPFE